MIRTLDILMIGALIAGAGYTFKVKHDAEQAVARVEELETRIRLENEAIDLLRADWSLLTSPDRLHALVERYKEELALEPVSPRQIVGLEEVPTRREALPGIDDEREAAAGPDRNVLTGSVGGEGEARTGLEGAGQ